MPGLIGLKRILSKKWAFMTFCIGAREALPEPAREGRGAAPLDGELCFGAVMKRRRADPRSPRSGVLMRAFFGALALGCASAARADEGCASVPPPADPGGRGNLAAGTGRVKTVSERLELTLEDGRLLKVSGLDPPRPTPDNPDLDIDSSVKLAGWVVGKDVAFRLLDARPDRWGRLAAEVFAPMDASTSPARPLAQTAIEAGLARFEPGAAARPCRTELLAAEARARAAALGLWADPYYAIIAASYHGAFAERAGTSVVVEGRVIGVDQGAYRTMLLFGPRRGWDFSVTILQRNTKIFSAAEFDFNSFKGRMIRVRGLLDMRFGPQVKVSNPDEIEAITQERDEAGPDSAPRR
jgi:endonuclease YncB( thermonuclease family)